ncbi:MAG: DUF1343 domain-containing protein [Myxococcales bacterium]
MAVLTGLDRISGRESEALHLVQGRRVGLLAHPASVDGSLRHAESVLEGAGARVVALFGPEHGYAGEAQDMVGVDAEQRHQVPVYSLYGSTFDDLSPRPEWVRGLDAVVIDLQDVGSRYYTFVWSAALMLRVCAREGVPCLVLDRPNPLGCEVMEGAPQRPGYRSFVGLYDLPVRHAMTIGEILNMVRRLDGLDHEALNVVRMFGYERSMQWYDTGLPWVLPSPNMPTPNTAFVYPGGCLIEGTNLSEGRGTTRPFEIWGAPFVDGRRLARDLSVHAEGAILRPLMFEPTFHKHAGQRCGGVQVHVTDALKFRSYALYLRMIAYAALAAGGGFAFRRETYEYVSDIPAIDLLTGGPEFREAVESRSALDDLFVLYGQYLAAFEPQRREWLLY